MVSAYIKVTGEVQGVGYRYFAFKNANELGIRGYVRNLADGSVEVLAEGEKELIEHYKSILSQGPGFSSVDQIEILFSPYQAKYKSFSVEY